MQTLYEQDFYAWTKEQAQRIKMLNIEGLDSENLYEEVLSMGISQHSELKNRLAVLLTHLLKLNYQIDKNGHSWKYTIKEQRLRLKDLLKEMPSLKSTLDATVTKSYKYGVLNAVKETGLRESIFPTECPWNITQILDDEFYPNQ